MSKQTKYILLSLPSSITPSHHRDDALDAISSTIPSDNGVVTPFPIPEFKIGTLDALVQQADELAKAEGFCQAVVAKVGDALRSVLDGDEEQIARMKTVNESMSRTSLFCLPVVNNGIPWSEDFRVLTGFSLVRNRAFGSVSADISME